MKVSHELVAKVDRLCQELIPHLQGGMAIDVMGGITATLPVQVRLDFASNKLFIETNSATIAQMFAVFGMVRPQANEGWWHILPIYLPRQELRQVFALLIERLHPLVRMSGWKAKEVALIACGKAKAQTRQPAHKLYTGQLFKAQFAYAQTLELPSYGRPSFPFENICILSAEHGLLLAHQELDPYNHSLAMMTAREREVWGAMVVDSLVTRFPAVQRVHLLAGRLYWEPLLRPLSDEGIEVVTVTPPGLGYGQQVKWFKEAANGKQ